MSKRIKPKKFKSNILFLGKRVLEAIRKAFEKLRKY